VAVGRAAERGDLREFVLAAAVVGVVDHRAALVGARRQAPVDVVGQLHLVRPGRSCVGRVGVDFARFARRADRVLEQVRRRLARDLVPDTFEFSVSDAAASELQKACCLNGLRKFTHHSFLTPLISPDTFDFPRMPHCPQPDTAFIGPACFCQYGVDQESLI